MKKFFAPTIFLLTAALAGASPSRVVSLVPSHTEIVEALGAENTLAGISEADDPSHRPDLPRVGGLEPNWEMLVALKPDMILADTYHARYKSTFERLKLPVVFLRSTKAITFEDIFSVIKTIGEETGRLPEAEAMIAGLQARLKVLRARVPPGPGPKIYFEIWPKPVRACSPGSLQGYLLAQAGARNIVPPTPEDIPLMSLEWVPQQAPDVILHTGVIPTAEITSRPGWSGVPAVRDGRVYAVDRDLFSRAGPRILDAYEQLLDLLYGKKHE